MIWRETIFGAARTTYRIKIIESIAEMRIAMIAAISIIFSQRREI